MTAWFNCRECHGTGRVFEPWYSKESKPCFRCDGTGNACVDGEQRRHQRRLHDEMLERIGRKGLAS